ncbi:MAG: noncanonical pyrimidine nucleotidase, YjjG family, partial [Clostridiales bacterium]|nr:noncanonical pyrimidine nucleotidase, YjjG family [Clostridiales bacterium]
MIDTLLIDLDNTILDFNKAEGPALAGALRAMGIEPTEKLLGRYSVINLAHWKRLEKGQITMAEVKVSRFRQLFDEFGITVSPAETAKVYEGLLAIGHYFVEGAEDMLEELYGKYRLYLASNGIAKVQ